MATLGSKLITKEAQWHANLTAKEHLGKAAMIAPAIIMEKMGTLFSSTNYFSDNTLSTILKGVKGGEVTIEGTAWEWQMKDASTRPIVITSKVETSKKPGQFKRTFKMLADQDWYKVTDTITPGTSNKKYLSVIVDGPKRKGDSWEYTCQLLTNNSNDFIPTHLLEPGTKWFKYFSISGEASEKGGSTQFGTNIAMRNKLSNFRKEYRITDYASTDVLRVGIPDSNGNAHKYWIRYAEVEFLKQWYKELEIARWYSRSTDTIYQDNGRPYETGPGLQEQLEDGHNHGYNVLSAPLIQDYLMDIFYGRVKPGSGRHVEGFSGEFGMLNFHEALNDMVNKSGFIRNVDVYVKSDKSDLHSNALQVGYQYVRFNMANGSSLKLNHLLVYDNLEIHNDYDEITGKPIESQRISFLDFAGEAGKSNIKSVKKKDGDSFNYVNGLYGPYGPSNKSHVATHAGKYYEMHIEAHEGINIEDVTKCGELKAQRR